MDLNVEVRVNGVPSVANKLISYERPIILNYSPEMKVEVNSYTDCRGSKEYNLNLSNRRSKQSRSLYSTTEVVLEQLL